MSTMKLKLMLAGAFVAGAFGGVAMGIAWATPSHGFASITLAGPVTLDAIDIAGETDTHEVELKTKGVWETRVVAFNMAPGGTHRLALASGT